MKLTIDTDTGYLTCEEGKEIRTLPLYSPEAFEVLSLQWLRVGWTQKYSYSFTWLGRPVIQLPEDLLRLQETIFSVRPDVIIETGIAHGGSLIFYASLCKLLGKGRVIGVDLRIRPENRRALESDSLAERLRLVEGSSTDPAVVADVRGEIPPGGSVLVILDSDHSKTHVLEEMESYGPLVSPGSYLVVMDGVVRDLADVPGGKIKWRGDNPVAAIEEFLLTHPEYRLEEPPWLFNESALRGRVTYAPSAFLRRVGS